MKRWSNQQILNILFYGLLGALVVVVCVSNLLMQKNDTFQSEAETAHSPEATILPTLSPTPAPGVDLERFLHALSSANIRISDPGEKGILYLRDPDRAGRMRLSYAVSKEKVYALTLDFFVSAAPTPTPPARPRKPLKLLIESHDKEELEKQNRSLEKMIRVLTDALCQKAPLPDAVVLRWYDGAVAAREKQSDYGDTYADVDFTAAATADGSDTILRCSLILH